MKTNYIDDLHNNGYCIIENVLNPNEIFRFKRRCCF